MLPAAVRSEAGGVSSFGYAGTIAHAAIEVAAGHGEQAVETTGLLGLAMRHAAGLTYQRNTILSNGLPHPFV